MFYLKNKISYATYCDPKTRDVISRGGITAVKVLSDHMKKRIRAGGIIECSEEEYKAYLRKTSKGSSQVSPKQEEEVAEVQESEDEEEAPENTKDSKKGGKKKTSRRKPVKLSKN